MRRTLRTQSLVENFMELHNEGMSIPRIARIFDVEPSAVYHYLLDEIAEKNGVNRKSLLQRVVKKGRNGISTNKEKVDIEELKAGIKMLEIHIHTMIDKLKNILEDSTNEDIRCETNE